VRRLHGASAIRTDAISLSLGLLAGRAVLFRGVLGFFGESGRRLCFSLNSLPAGPAQSIAKRWSLLGSCSKRVDACDGKRTLSLLTSDGKRSPIAHDFSSAGKAWVILAIRESLRLHSFRFLDVEVEVREPLRCLPRSRLDVEAEVIELLTLARAHHTSNGLPRHAGCPRERAQ
jgi:hypothetical protein